MKKKLLLFGKILVKVCFGILLVVVLAIPAILLMFISATPGYMNCHETSPPIPEDGKMDKILKKTLYPLCDKVFEW